MRTAPHFLDTGNGVFLVLGRDKRVRYPAETKLRAVEMIRAGYGRDAIAESESAPDPLTSRFPFRHDGRKRGKGGTMGTPSPK